jgi:hypothetical protein
MLHVCQFSWRPWLAATAWLGSISCATGAASAQPGTLVPAESTPPAATTPYDIAKGLGGQINRGLEALADLGIRRRIDRWKVEHWAEIQKAMPAKGGIYVIAYIAKEKNVGMSQAGARCYLGARIGTSGASEKEARAQGTAPSIDIADPNRPLRDTPLFDPQFFETIPIHEWIPATSGPPPAPDLKPLGETATEVQQRLAELKEECDRERKRLDQEWEGIKNQKQRISRQKEAQSRGDADRSSPPPAGSEDAALASWQREQARLKTLDAVEKNAIGVERSAVDAEARNVAAIQQELNAYIIRWRCPAGLTLEKCELHQNAGRTIHLAERQAFRAKRDRLSAEIARRTRDLDIRKRAMDKRVGDLPRITKDRHSAAQAKAQDSIERAKTRGHDRRLQDRAQEKFRERLEQFERESHSLTANEELLKKSKRIFETLRASLSK